MDGDGWTVENGRQLTLACLCICLYDEVGSCVETMTFAWLIDFTGRKGYLWGYPFLFHGKEKTRWCMSVGCMELMNLFLISGETFTSLLIATLMSVTTHPFGTGVFYVGSTMYIRPVCLFVLIRGPERLVILCCARCHNYHNASMMVYPFMARGRMRSLSQEASYVLYTTYTP